MGSGWGPPDRPSLVSTIATEGFCADDECTLCDARENMHPAVIVDLICFEEATRLETFHAVDVCWTNFFSPKL